MAAPKGNEFWKLRSKHGRDKLFSSPELLWEAACEYFKWCEDNPLIETKAFNDKGKIIYASLPKMRAMTRPQLCFYLHCSESYFRTFKSNATESDKGFLTVISEIENIIDTQKFQGAAADLLNSNIISRDLGLKDHTEQTNIEQISKIEIEIIDKMPKDKGE